MRQIGIFLEGGRKLKFFYNCQFKFFNFKHVIVFYLNLSIFIASSRFLTPISKNFFTSLLNSVILLFMEVEDSTLICFFICIQVLSLTLIASMVGKPDLNHGFIMAATKQGFMHGILLTLCEYRFCLYPTKVSILDLCPVFSDKCVRIYAKYLLL